MTRLSTISAFVLALPLFDLWSELLLAFDTDTARRWLSVYRAVANDARWRVDVGDSIQSH